MSGEITKHECTEAPCESTRLYTPLVDIYEEGRDIVLLTDVPGAAEGSVDVSLDKNLLTIHAHVDTHTPEGLRPVRYDYGVGDYNRTFTISDEVDRDAIRASVKDGVLQLVLPRTEEKTRKITVRADA